MMEVLIEEDGAMKTIDLETLERTVALARELERLSDKLTPFLELVKEVGSPGFVPTATDRFIGRGEVRKLLRVGCSTVAKLISAGQLTPLYVAGSSEAKFRLSEVLKVPREERD